MTGYGNAGEPQGPTPTGGELTDRTGSTAGSGQAELRPSASSDLRQAAEDGAAGAARKAAPDRDGTTNHTTDTLPPNPGPALADGAPGDRPGGASADGDVLPYGPGLFFGHNMPPDRIGRTELPAPVANWPERTGRVIGFRPSEAVDIAAACFPANRAAAIVEVEPPAWASPWRPLGDDTGQAVHELTGEIVRLVPRVEKHPARPVYERKIARRLVIAGGKVAVECDDVGRVERRLEALSAAIDLADALDPDGQGEEGDTDEGSWADGPAHRRVVWEFSRKSRQRLRQRVAEADWYSALSMPGTRIGMVTLTYPGDWERLAPDPDAITAHRHALEKRMERAFGHLPAFFWVREWQRRGAPHFHLAGAFPATVHGLPFDQWLALAWYQIVASGDERHHRAGTRADWSEGLAASDPNRLAAYFSAYTTGEGSKEGGKEYQHHPPVGWGNDNGSAGRHWGYRGTTLTRADVPLTRDQLVEVQRFLRRYVASQKRAMRTRGRLGERKRPVTRRWRLSSLVGLDAGFTLLTNDGPSLAMAIARIITDHQEDQPWPVGQPRKMP